MSQTVVSSSFAPTLKTVDTLVVMREQGFINSIITEMRRLHRAAQFPVSIEVISLPRNTPVVAAPVQIADKLIEKNLRLDDRSLVVTDFTCSTALPGAAISISDAVSRAEAKRGKEFICKQDVESLLIERMGKRIECAVAKGKEVYCLLNNLGDHAVFGRAAESVKGTSEEVLSQIRFKLVNELTPTSLRREAYQLVRATHALPADHDLLTKTRFATNVMSSLLAAKEISKHTQEWTGLYLPLLFTEEETPKVWADNFIAKLEAQGKDPAETMILYNHHRFVGTHPGELEVMTILAAAGIGFANLCPCHGCNSVELADNTTVALSEIILEKKGLPPISLDFPKLNLGIKKEVDVLYYTTANGAEKAATQIAALKQAFGDRFAVFYPDPTGKCETGHLPRILETLPLAAIIIDGDLELKDRARTPQYNGNNSFLANDLQAAGVINNFDTKIFRIKTPNETPPYLRFSGCWTDFDADKVIDAVTQVIPIHRSYNIGPYLADHSFSRAAAGM